VQNLLSAANADYNWGWNLAAGSEGNGYNAHAQWQGTAIFSSGAPDANGGSGDPQFVDSTRDVATYDSAATGLGNSATAWADATAYSVGDLVSYNTLSFPIAAASGGAVGGTTNAITLAGAPSPPGAGDADKTYYFIPTYTNTSATTINTVAVVKDGNTALSGAELTAGLTYYVTYNHGLAKWSLSRKFYEDLTVNFRCITAHTSDFLHATNGPPGAAFTPTWRTNWELATVFRLRTDPSLIDDLVTWIKGGFQPGNASLEAAHDSVSPSNGWIGAVEGQSSVVTLRVAGLLISTDGQVQSVDASSGVPAGSTVLGGTALDASGKLCVHNLSASAVPAGAVLLGGLAHHADGRLYVTTEAPSNAVLLGGQAVRADGAVHVSVTGVQATDVIMGAMARTTGGVLRVSAVA
jgi:hypothetical protein